MAVTGASTAFSRPEDVRLRGVVVSLYQCEPSSSTAGNSSTSSAMTVPTAAAYRGDILVPYVDGATFAELAASLSWRLNTVSVVHAGATGPGGKTPMTAHSHVKGAGATAAPSSRKRGGGKGGRAQSSAVDLTQRIVPVEGPSKPDDGKLSHSLSGGSGPSSHSRFVCDVCPAAASAVPNYVRVEALWSSETGSSKDPAANFHHAFSRFSVPRGTTATVAQDAVPSSCSVRCFFSLDYGDAVDTPYCDQTASSPLFGGRDAVLSPAVFGGADPLGQLSLPPRLTVQVGDAVVRVGSGGNDAATLMDTLVSRLCASGPSSSASTSGAVASVGLGEVALPVPTCADPHLFLMDPATSACVLPCERVSVVAALVSVLHVHQPRDDQRQRAGAADEVLERTPAGRLRADLKRGREEDAGFGSVISMSGVDDRESNGLGGSIHGGVLATADLHTHPLRRLPQHASRPRRDGEDDGFISMGTSADSASERAGADRRHGGGFFIQYDGGLFGNSDGDVVSAPSIPVSPTGGSGGPRDESLLYALSSHASSSDDDASSVATLARRSAVKGHGLGVVSPFSQIPQRKAAAAPVTAPVGAEDVSDSSAISFDSDLGSSEGDSTSSSGGIDSPRSSAGGEEEEQPGERRTMTSDSKAVASGGELSALYGDKYHHPIDIVSDNSNSIHFAQRPSTATPPAPSLASQPDLGPSPLLAYAPQEGGGATAAAVARACTPVLSRHKPADRLASDPRPTVGSSAERPSYGGGSSGPALPATVVKPRDFPRQTQQPRDALAAQGLVAAHTPTRPGHGSGVGDTARRPTPSPPVGAGMMAGDQQREPIFYSSSSAASSSSPSSSEPVNFDGTISVHAADSFSALITPRPTASGRRRPQSPSDPLSLRRTPIERVWGDNVPLLQASSFAVEEGTPRRGSDTQYSGRDGARHALLSLVSPKPLAPSPLRPLQPLVRPHSQTPGGEELPTIMVTQQQLPEYVFHDGEDEDVDEDGEESEEGGSTGEEEEEEDESSEYMFSGV